MHTELIKRAREAEFFQDALRGLAAELPADDLELDGLLKEAAAGGEDLAFVNILWAALGANRKIQAHHLVAASEYLPNAGFLATASMRVEGDVAGALLEAVAQKALSWDRKAVALLMAGIWWKEHQTGDPPQELIPQARLLARSSREDPATQSVLLALADMFHADGLWSVLKMDGQDLDHEGAGKMRDLLVERAKAPVFHCVPASPPPRIISGYTVRRAVAEIGRNDPCPCGSGRKYKKCCLAKDQLRWERSSDVPGLTWEELDAQMEVHLTQDRLLNLRGPELARLDPTRVAVDLLPVLINRLLIYHDLESVVKLFEKLGVSAALTGHWDDALWYVTRSGQRPLLNRLLASRKDPPVEVADLPLGTRLVLANEDQDPVLRMIEAAASKALLRDDDVNPVTVAYDLLDSRYRALGILVARGAVAIADDLDALTLLDALLETRDKLNLPPEDPIEEMVDTWLSQVSHRENLDVKELAEAQNRLREKVEEVGRLKAKTAQLQHELDRHEKKVRARAPEPATPQTKPTRIESAPDAVTTELRQRVAALREELNQRHAERNQLRRELQKARTDIEQLREKPSPPSESDQNEEAAEENLLAAEEPVGNQPLRLPEFPRKFFETLEHLPKSVTRTALVLIGRLAAGEPSAFTGVKRIKAVRDIWRQRVAGDYRLLFRLRPEVLEIVALINRRDLEKKIKTL